MKISSAFPSEFLRAADLNGQQVKVVMAHVEMREVGNDHRPVLFFQGKEKGVVLNKTNSNAISSLYGDDTDDWAGREIVLFEMMVSDPHGKIVPSIRVKAPAVRNNEPRPQPVQQHTEINPPPHTEADVPF